MSTTPTLQEQACPARTPARGTLSALIVDDEAHARSYARLLLESLGVKKIWEAGGGAEGLILYMKHRPSVVLLDVNMPVMSGDVMMARLIAIDPEAAVIVMTSETQTAIVRYFQELGAISYVLKHVPRAQVAQLLGEALDSLLETDEDGDADEA